MHLERVDVDAHAALAALVRLVRVRVRVRGEGALCAISSALPPFIRINPSLNLP